MATIKNKSINFYAENPNGTSEELNNLTEYSIMYSNTGKYYYLCVSPCTINDWGGVSMELQFGDHYATLAKVSRRNAKIQRTCEEFVKNNLTSLNTAYINNGIAGVKEVVRDLCHIA